MKFWKNSAMDEFVLIVEQRLLVGMGNFYQYNKGIRNWLPMTLN